MSNVLPALNDHVRRLARREIRAATVKTKRASAQYRRDIAALKRLIRGLSTRLAACEKRGGNSRAVVASAPVEGLRFRKDGLKTHRAKLGLSAKDYGALIGVTGLTIYHWESGVSKPRRKQLPAIAAVRKMGKREALTQLMGK